MTKVAQNHEGRRRRKMRIASIGVGCALGLVGGEFGARVFAWMREASKRSAFERMRSGNATLPVDRDAKLGEIVAPSAHDDVVYELIPGAIVRFQGVECRFNTEGFRGPPPPPRERAPGSVRIVGLGDSVTFGWGVNEPDCFLRRVERSLRERLPDRIVDVINTGVPGYNTAMEVAAFAHRADRLRPDIVLLDWVGNDADLPNLIANESDPLDLSRSFLYDLARKALGWRTQWQTGPLMDAPFAGEHYERDPLRVPERYRDMVGEAGVERAMRRLAALAELQRFRVVVCSHYGVPDFVRRVSDQLGWPVLDGVDDVHAALRERGLEPQNYRTSDLVLSPDDPHPSSRAHARYAQRLCDFLQKAGWLENGALSPR